MKKRLVRPSPYVYSATLWRGNDYLIFLPSRCFLGMRYTSTRSNGFGHWDSFNTIHYLRYEPSSPSDHIYTIILIFICCSSFCYFKNLNTGLSNILSEVNLLILHFQISSIASKLDLQNDNSMLQSDNGGYWPFHGLLFTSVGIYIYLFYCFLFLFSSLLPRLLFSKYINFLVPTKSLCINTLSCLCCSWSTL